MRCHQENLKFDIVFREKRQLERLFPPVLFSPILSGLQEARNKCRFNKMCAYENYVRVVLHFDIEELETVGGRSNELTKPHEATDS